MVREAQRTEEQRYLLALDGGGLRGIIQATLLVQLEQVTGRLTRETFSYVAGTSTGALIAAAVAAGIPAERIVDLYLTRAREVFTNHRWRFLQRLVAGSMYSTRTLHRIIADELGPARDWALNDCPIDILITAKRLTDGMPWYFVRDTPRNARRTGHLRLADCATASAAEPTYFQPWQMPENPAWLPPSGERVGTLAGGGVGVAGNPVYQACVEAFDYTVGYNQPRTVVVSLGTGRFMTRRRPTWLWPWFRWILDELLSSPGEQQTELVQRHFPAARFYRIDCRLHRDIPLDDINSVEELHRYGEQLAQQVNWPAILNSTDSTFRIRNTNTLWQQYSRP